MRGFRMLIGLVLAFLALTVLFATGFDLCSAVWPLLVGAGVLVLVYPVWKTFLSG